MCSYFHSLFSLFMDAAIISGDYDCIYFKQQTTNLLIRLYWFMGLSPPICLHSSSSFHNSQVQIQHGGSWSLLQNSSMGDYAMRDTWWKVRHDIATQTLLFCATLHCNPERPSRQSCLVLSLVNFKESWGDFSVVYIIKTILNLRNTQSVGTA